MGLNSGQVIAGEIGSGRFRLHRDRRAGRDGAADGVGRPAGRGDAQRDPPRGWLSTRAVLGEPEMVQIKGADEPVPPAGCWRSARASRLVGRAESSLVGRRWEMSAVEGMVDRAIDGHGAVVGVVGPPGIGKSRLVREVAAMAAGRGVEVFTAFCESHASEVPFHAVARLLRAATGVARPRRPGRPRPSARPDPDADPEDLLLL